VSVSPRDIPLDNRAGPSASTVRYKCTATLPARYAGKRCTQFTATQFTATQFTATQFTATQFTATQTPQGLA